MLCAQEACSRQLSRGVNGTADSGFALMAMRIPAPWCFGEQASRGVRHTAVMANEGHRRGNKEVFGYVGERGK